MSEKKSWEASESYCQSIAPSNTSANLASVGDDATNMFLSMMTSGVQAWIGGQQDDVGVWSWSDGRNWNFTSWATGRVDTRYLLIGKKYLETTVLFLQNYAILCSILRHK